MCPGAMLSLLKWYLQIDVVHTACLAEETRGSHEETACETSLQGGGGGPGQARSRQVTGAETNHDHVRIGLNRNFTAWFESASHLFDCIYAPRAMNMQQATLPCSVNMNANVVRGIVAGTTADAWQAHLSFRRLINCAQLQTPTKHLTGCFQNPVCPVRSPHPRMLEPLCHP